MSAPAAPEWPIDKQKEEQSVSEENESAKKLRLVRVLQDVIFLTGFVAIGYFVFAYHISWYVIIVAWFVWAIMIGLVGRIVRRKLRLEIKRIEQSKAHRVFGLAGITLYFLLTIGFLYSESAGYTLSAFYLLGSVLYFVALLIVNLVWTRREQRAEREREAEKVREKGEREFLESLRQQH